MTFERPEQIDGALQRLGKRLTYDYADPIALVICGGSALNVLNIAYRTTKDVDVLAVVDETENGVKLRHDRVLPEFFRRNVASVGRDLGLDEDWLNMGPKDVIAVYGPPKGMMDRLNRREYGPCLTVYFVSRLDQVHFKVLAAADPKAQPHHLEDLVERIKPLEDEVRAAVNWLMNRETSSWFRGRVKYVVETLGYDSISNEIQE